ncbi:DsbA family protein [Mesorhizobium sp. KR9-304]|uniref:DsbA family protein n=1 Tax=Mesorhizobium sp. KR9-304 TaxID=3156614 RepID=UPI0032B61269
MTGTSINRRLLIAGATSFLASTSLPRRAIALPSVDEVAHDPAIPALANPEGDVTLVEFVDYQCPYCKLCYLEIMKLVAEDGGIRLVVKDWPIFGPPSEFAARALLASTDDPAYAGTIDALMRNERKLTRLRTERLLDDAGISIAALGERMEACGPGIDQVLARNAAQASDFRLAGTPALLVGGVLYRHGLPLAALKEAVAVARASPNLSAT